MSTGATRLKRDVLEFWDEASCGEVYARGDDIDTRLERQAQSRYELEPYIMSFARFEEGGGNDVLEVGVGMGADHAQWARHAPHSLIGIDFTSRAVSWTASRLRAHGLSSSLMVGDAEWLPFDDSSFDLVYSWGVLHHTPGTDVAIREVHRVLRPGGRARIMIYHAPSIIGYVLWTRYALLAGHPRRSMRQIYHDHLESPGTKAYSVEEAHTLLASFRHAEITTQLSFGDLLLGDVGARHNRTGLAVMKALWPRWFIRRVLRGYGSMLLINATK